MTIFVNNKKRYTNIKGVYQLIDSKNNGTALCDTETFFLRTQDDRIWIMHGIPFEIIEIKDNEEFKIIHSYHQIFDEK